MPTAAAAAVWEAVTVWADVAGGVGWAAADVGWAVVDVGWAVADVGWDADVESVVAADFREIRKSC